MLVPLRDLGRMNGFPEVRWMGRMRRREGVVGESSLGAQALVLWKALHVCFPGRSEEILSPCATALSEESFCNLWNAKSFLFSPLLLFPCFFQCNLTVTFLCSCAPSYLRGAGAVFCTPLTNMLSSSQLCTLYSGPQPRPLHGISYEKQLLPLCEPLFLSFSSSSPFVL